MRFAITAFWVTVVGLAGAQTAPPKVQTPDVVVPPKVEIPSLRQAIAPLSVEEAVRIALREQPSIQNAEGNRQAAGGRRRQSTAGLGPSLNINGQLQRQESLNPSSGGGGGGVVIIDPNNPTVPINQNNGNQNRGFFTNARLTLNLTQLLYDFGRTRDQVRQQTALSRAATIAIEQANLDVAFNVRQRYADFVQAKRLVTAAETNVANRQSQLRLTEVTLAEGLGPPADVVNAKTNLASATAALITARANEVNARMLLAQAMGVDPRTPLVPQAEYEPGVVPADPTDLFSGALVNRPETRQAQKTLEATGYAVDAASKTNRPSLNLTGSVLSNGTNDPFTTQTGTFGFSLNWPLFDNGVTAGAIEAARGNQKVALANLKTAQLTVLTDVGQAYVNLATAIQRVTVAEVSYANAQEGVRLAEGRYRGGFGTFLEITNAQAQLFTAQQALETARGDVARAQAALDRATGKSVR